VTKTDVLNGAKGKPVPFEFEGFTCLLRPLLWPERHALIEYVRDHGSEPGSGLELQTRFVLAGVSDADGKPLLERDDIEAFSVTIADAVAKEVAKRNGLDGKAAGEPGKGASPTTTS